MPSETAGTDRFVSAAEAMAALGVSIRVAKSDNVAYMENDGEMQYFCLDVVSMDR